jgi:hypothetical protein
MYVDHHAGVVTWEHAVPMGYDYIAIRASFYKYGLYTGSVERDMLIYVVADTISTQIGNDHWHITDSIVQVLENYTAISAVNDISAEPAIHIYPNPNSGSFTLETANLSGQTYIITDMLGQIVQEKIIASDKQHIDMSSSAAGVYTLMIKGRSGALRVVLR